MKDYYTYKHLKTMFADCPNIQSLTIYRDQRLCYITQINEVNIPSFEKNTESEWKSFYIESEIKDFECDHARNVSGGFYLPEIFVPVAQYTILKRADFN